MKLNRFKYAVGPGLWREYTQLCTSLDEALLKLDDYAKLGLVPSGHAPHKAFAGRPAHETTPFRDYLTGRPWEVVEIFTYRTDGQTSEHWLAEFARARDAFAFAELMTKQAKERLDTQNSYFVSLRGWTEDGRHPELARLAADHLTQLRRAAARARDRAEKRKQRQRLAA